MTATTSASPGDVLVIKLGRDGLRAGRPKTWASGDVAGLDRKAFVEPQLFTFRAPGVGEEDHFNIPGFVYLPRGRGPFPVVIWIHGGPESQYRPAFNETVQAWVSQLGVAVLAPNVRGSMGYGRGYLVLDDGAQREAAVRDIGALLDWIGNQRRLDASRVAVFGSSYGGYMALASAVHYSDRLVAAIDRAGISNFVTYLENTSDYRRDLRRFEYGDERDPVMREFLESISPLNNVDRISIPLLIVQGQNDPVVPASESEQMVRALRERGQTVWYMNALNEGHGYERQDNQDAYQQVSYLFLQRFLTGED
jgi:dipeptidyl aminopeptidase/acylaminoacyl peptidase